ncbi:DNA-binding transcriptional LysR family regulator [Streptomyces griseochromogenes]|uniref:DNA-binding transcriptional LysR family regulator n=1 Tax=Streptomyces griseochromogenes TaxID=68214 RepID=A0ABS4M6M4_9ACTN|nr:LysR family transcriptional regulator [Streptomyces griseochromogenes]MBP2055303.1 DNA-binding transcriptional LysR family regulator [Streptomyces griseochromogenes]
MSDQGIHGAGPLDLNLLRTFLAVHRLGSFTAAARQLGLSQSTVTTQIRALENRLGRELFQRRAHGVTPLPHADELAGQLSAPLDQLAAIAGEEPSSTVAPVHLAGPAEFMSVAGLHVLAPLVAQGVRLRVTIGLTEHLLEELRAGRHDLVVATRRPRGRTLHAELLADEEFVLVAAPAWAERLKGQELPAALETLPLITYAEDLPIARRYWRHVFNRRLHTQAAITIPDLRGVLTAVTAGAGWSVLPSYMCRTELASGALRLLHQPEDPPINTAYLVQRPGSSTNPHVTLVRECLVTAAKTW